VSFRFLHLADVHLETCFGGKPRTRERLREATLTAFDDALDFARDEKLHAVLVAGDLFDDGILSPRVQWRIVERVRRLSESGCWFLYCCGNHDPGQARRWATRLGLEADGDPEEWQTRVRLFRDADPRKVTVTDAHGAAVGLVIGAGHVTSAVSDNLCRRFPRLSQLEPVERELPVVGLLHTQVDHARGGEAHAVYAPSTREDYEAREFAYWALGHVHIRQQAVEGLPVWYSGNLQGRNPRETGPKGGWVVEARAGLPATPEFRSFAPVRWERIEIDDLSEVTSMDGLVRRMTDAVSSVADGTTELAARIVLRGACPRVGDLRDAEQIAEVIEDVEIQTGALELQLRLDGLHLPIDIDELRGSATVVAKAFEVIEEARRNPELFETLAPEELASEDTPDRPAYLNSLLEGAEAELLERLAVPEDDA